MNRKYTEVTLDQIVKSPRLCLGQAYMLTQISGETTLDELSCADKYFFIEDEEDIDWITPEPVTKEEPEEEPSEEPEEAEQGHRGRRKTIDTGKIEALWKAGWTGKAIADELGCAPSTITYHLSKMGYKVPRQEDKS